MNTSWIPVAEQLPERKTVVIVGQSIIGRYRIFAGWLDGGAWYSYCPKHPNEIVATHDAAGDFGFVAEMGDLRAEDFWLHLPAHSPTGSVVQGGYPA